MKRIWIVLITLLLLLGVTACGQKTDTSPEESLLTWQEQYDLGIRYLSEGKYEEAILAFTAAIEIDAKKVEAYVSLADVYMAQDDPESALAVLQQGLDATGDESIAKHMESLQNTADRNEDDPARQEHSTPDIPRLSYRDFSFTYFHDPDLLKWAEGALGHMNVEVTVDGPSEVRGVRIYLHSGTAMDLEQDWAYIQESSQEVIDNMKETNWQLDWSEPPVSSREYYGIFPEDLGEPWTIILLGLDADMNIVGYEAIPVQVPTEIPH